MILELIQRLLSDGPIYVRIRRQLLSVRDVRAKRTVEDAPLVAMSNGQRRGVLAVGASASVEAAKLAGGFQVMNAFDHPRLIVSDFVIAEAALRYFVRKLVRNRLFRSSPVVVVHVLETLDGGLTQVEIRALQELALAAGAREAYVWTGRELTDREFETRKFPGDHWLPNRPKWAEPD